MSVLDNVAFDRSLMVDAPGHLGNREGSRTGGKAEEQWGELSKPAGRLLVLRM
jgi:hypothetical protein